MFRVHFEYFGRNIADDVDPRKFSIPELSRGFWINGNLQLTTASDHVYFIPPGKIIAVERIQ